MQYYESPEHVTNTVNDLDVIQLQIKDLYTFIIEDGFEPMISTLMKDAGVNTFCLIGETPHFNDGDPCTHSHDTLDEDLQEDWTATFESEFDGQEIPSTVFEDAKKVNDLTFLHDVLNHEQLLTVMETVYGTNWFRLYYFDSRGNLEVMHGEHEPLD